MKHKHPKFACFLTVRTGSSRLPQKALLEIRGKRLIEHVIDRVRLVNGTNQIILCTSDDPSDDILEKIAKKNKIDVFRGSLNDKIARWLGATKKFKIDYFINVDAADDIFCDPELIDMAINQMKKNPCDYLEIPDDLVCGGAARCISTKALKRVFDIKDTDQIEDYRPYFVDTGLFNTGEIVVADRIFHNGSIRLTIDYQEDFDLVARIFDEFSTDTNDIPLRKIVKLLNKKPELNQINLFRHEEYWNKIKKNRQLVIKKA